MRITKSGFYKLSELLNLPFPKGVPGNEMEGGGIINIIIDDNITVIFFDDLNQSIDIEIGENSRVEFYSVIENVDNHSIKFLQNKDFSKLTVKCLLLSKDNIKSKTKIFSDILASNTISDIHIISMVGNDGFVDLDGIIQINENIEKVNANLLEENIFLGSSGKVKGMPTLLVRSNDVKASHACKMDRISDEKLFYLRSRGIDRDNALFMMLESYISSMFKCLSMVDDNFYKELFENIIKKIK